MASSSLIWRQKYLQLRSVSTSFLSGGPPTVVCKLAGAASSPFHRSRRQMASSAHQSSGLPPADPQRIHVLGIGNIGRLFAHSLRALPWPPPITLLFHRPSLLSSWEQNGRVVEMLAVDGSSNKQSGFEVEVIDPSKADDVGTISNLLISTKAPKTLAALTPLKARLNQHSNLLFAQNGMGSVEEALALFPDPQSRPKVFAAVTSHGVFSTGPFSSLHAGTGWVAIGPAEPASYKSSPDMVTAVLSCPTLNARSVSASELLYLKLEKLAVNATINPLTAMFRVKNGVLFKHAGPTKLMHRLVAEMSTIFQQICSEKAEEQSSSTEAEAGDVKQVFDRFSAPRLQEFVLNMAHATRENRSSMFQDVEAGRETEIAYINGWIVQEGEKRGLAVESHTWVAETVREGRILDVSEDNIEAEVKAS